MAKGISLHIGLNYVDPNHYSGWDGKLNACEFDAVDMSSIASAQGFKATKLIRSDATRKNLLSALQAASKSLQSGDIFMMSYSGHGGQVPDINYDEADNIDETWCLYDGQFIDDELYFQLSKFKGGVRVLVISDSCHSGTMIKVARGDAHTYSEYAPRFMNYEVAANTYVENKQFYDKIGAVVKNESNVNLKARVKLISGCQDNQYSYDGPFNGQFTGNLKRVWNGGAFRGNYSKFHKMISNLLPAYQSPNYWTIGEANKSFDSQKPFTI